MTIATLLAGVVIMLTTRLFLIQRYEWVGSDTYYQFIVGEEIKKRKSLVFTHNRFLIPEKFDYPPLVPLIVSAVNARHHRRLQLLGPASDLLTALVVGVVGWQIGGAQVGALTVLIYATTPYAFGNSYSFGPRPIANLFFTCGLVSLLLLDVPIWSWSIAMLFGILIVLTHRLTLQNWLMVLLGLSLFDPALALAILTTSLAASLLIPGIDIRLRLVGHLEFMKTLSVTMPTGKDIVRTIGLILQRNPHFVTLIVILIVGPPLDQNFFTLLAVVGLIFLLSLVWPFGQGDRHFVNASPAVAMLIATAETGSHIDMLTLLGCVAGLSVILLQTRRYPLSGQQGAGTVVDGALIDACDFIRTHWVDDTLPMILTFPRGLSYRVMYFANARGYLGSGGSGKGRAFSLIMTERLNLDSSSVLEEFGTPDYIIALHEALNPLNANSLHLVYSNNRVGVFVMKGNGD